MSAPTPDIPPSYSTGEHIPTAQHPIAQLSPPASPSSPSSMSPEMMLMQQQMMMMQQQNSAMQTMAMTQYVNT